MSTPIRTSPPIQIETGANIAVSNLPVAMRMKTIAAPFAAIFAALALVVAHSTHSTVGLPVRIAKTRACRPYEEDALSVFVHVLRPGVIQLNSEPLQTQELEGRLEAIFRTRVYRYVLVTSEPDLQFGDVTDIIDRSAKQVDQVVLVTPSVMSQLGGRPPRVCFDENLPRDYLRHPPR
jgi:biopolymer transport protein ExbD